MLVLDPGEGQTIVQPQQPEPGVKRPFRVTEDADDGYLNLRSGPGMTYDVIAQMPVGTTGLMGTCVPLAGGYLPFCEVEWNGKHGWASSCCIADVEQSTAPTQTAARKQSQLDKREQCKGKAKRAQFFCALAGYDPAYCLEYRLRVQQVCEQD